MKKESHKIITRKAIDIYCGTRHTQLTNAMNDNRMRSAVVKGSIDEDGKTFTRLLNWHFYPSNSTLKNQEQVDCYIFSDIVTPTSERILTKRQNDFMRLVKQGPSYWLFKVFGRILHHIQDMSTPSHVFPIYHSSGKKSDPYEIYLVEESNRIFKKALEGSSNFYDAMSSELTGDFLQLYHEAASRLLDHLKPENSHFSYLLNNSAVEGDTSLFWEAHNPDENYKDSPCKIEGFGVFGKLSRSYGVSAPVEINGSICKVDESVYLKLATDMVTMAIKDTMTALVLFEELIAQEFEGHRFGLDDPDSYDD